MSVDELNLQNVGRQAPPTPSKYDIIPIHTSDRGTFKDCRRRWDWSSPARMNLTRKVRIHGITWPLFFGTAIHYALERYYNPVLREDPVVEFQAFMDLHWNGGMVTEEDVKRFGLEEREPVLRKDGSIVVQGLKILLPNSDPAPFEEHLDMGVGMLNFYKDYAQRKDNFSVISVEHDFSIPILDPEGNPLYAVDTRQMPKDWEPDFSLENMYGPLMREGFDDKERSYTLEKQVHARGRNDKIIQDNQSGQFGIHDYKTSSRQIDDNPLNDYYKHLDLDEQCTTYLAMGEREAEMYDLEYKKLDFIIYEALIKGYPKPPTILKDGLSPSIARTTETTTAQMFERYVEEAGLKVIFDNTPAWQNYYAYLLEQGDRRFINRKPIYRNKAQKDNCGRRLYLEAMDMLSDPHIYPNPRKEYMCLNCAFRGPCVMAEDGSDYISVLEDAYQVNYDR